MVFLTHFESAQIQAHFERLKAETSGLLDAFLCVHEPAKRIDVEPLAADFRVSSSDAKTLLPRRYADMQRRGGRIMPGFTDLTAMPALLDKRLSGYAHIWLVEYDVDFAGPWNVFFAPLAGRKADLITTTLYPRRQCPGWTHWSWFTAPHAVPLGNQVRSFHPIARFSRRLLKRYVESVGSEAWHGHSEALYPTVARHCGFAIEDMGGHGPFTPPSMRGKNYVNRPSVNGDLTEGSFVFRPVRHRAYFHAAPDRFTMRGRLYHPIKVHDGTSKKPPRDESGEARVPS